MKLLPARRDALAGELKRALEKRWRKRLLKITVRLVRPRILTDGEAFHLVADGGQIRVEKGTIGDLPVSGVVELGRQNIHIAGGTADLVGPKGKILRLAFPRDPTLPPLGALAPSSLPSPFPTKRER